MKPNRSSRSPLPATASFLCFAALALAVGCLPTAEQVRSVTYPPDFTYVPTTKVDSVMWALARNVDELDHLMTAPGSLDDGRRATALALLTTMEREARSLEARGENTNHPVLDAHLEGFVARLVDARDALERDPPDPFLAGSVSGACLTCHGGTKAETTR